MDPTDAELAQIQGIQDALDWAGVEDDLAAALTVTMLGSAALLITSCTSCWTCNHGYKPDKSCNKSSKSVDKSNNPD